MGKLSGYSPLSSSNLLGSKEFFPFVTVGPAGTFADYVCDGLADDVEIQSAINALPSTGGSVFLKAGTYNFTNQVSRSIQYVKIFGEGYATILKWQDNTNPSSVGLIKTYNFWTISDLQMDGNKANNSGGYGIYIYQSTRVIIENLYIGNCADDSIRINGAVSPNMAHANKFSNLYIRDGGAYGINGINSSPDNQFVNIWVGVCNAGMHIGAAACFLTNIHLWGNTTNGLEIAASDVRVTNGYYETNGGAGITLTGTFGTPIKDIKIVAAHMLQNGANGITGSNINKSIINSCTFKDNTGIGATFADSADLIVSSSAFGNDKSPKVQTYGMTTTGTTDRVILTDNNIRAVNELTGNYLLVGSNNIVANNMT